VFTVSYELDLYVYFKFIFAFKGLQESGNWLCGSLFSAKCVALHVYTLQL
jgi:hypothetical protein